MFSTKFDCDFVDLMGAYRQSDRVCPPGDWLRLDSTRKIIEDLASAWEREINDFVIRGGKGGSASCWAHPILETGFKEWAGRQRFKDAPPVAIPVEPIKVEIAEEIKRSADER